MLVSVNPSMAGKKRCKTFNWLFCFFIDLSPLEDLASGYHTPKVMLSSTLPDQVGERPPMKD